MIPIIINEHNRNKIESFRLLNSEIGNDPFLRCVRNT